jgi:hypothetical protein
MPFSVKTRAKFPLLDTFIYYLNERWSIHQKRLKGLPPPWTDDAALQKYRFCQVRREDDRVTRWIHENWLRPRADDPDLWHAMCVARIFNLPSTLDAIGWPEPWGKRGAKVLATARKLKADGATIYTGAYSTCCGLRSSEVGIPLINHHEKILNLLWAKRKAIQPHEGETLRAFYERLTTQFGFGTFMSNQVVADTKHGDAMYDASDWLTFAASGSGSLRGMNLLCGRDVVPRWRGGEADWHATLLEVRKAILPSLPKPLRHLDAQNIEHGLCEMFKWHRAQEAGRKLTRPYKETQSTYCGKDTK